MSIQAPVFSTRLRRHRYPSNIYVLLALAAAALFVLYMVISLHGTAGEDLSDEADSSTGQDGSLSSSNGHHHRRTGWEGSNLGGTASGGSSVLDRNSARAWAQSLHANHGGSAAGGWYHPHGLPEIWAQGPPLLPSNGSSFYGGASAGVSSTGRGAGHTLTDVARWELARRQEQLLELVGEAQVKELREMCGRALYRTLTSYVQVWGVGVRGLWACG